MSAAAIRGRAAAVCLLAASALLAVAGAEAARPVAVRLIGINDFHGNLEPANLVLASEAVPATSDDTPPLRIPAGGAAALAGLVEALRAGQKHTLMVSAGDMVGAAPLISTLFKHESTVEIMNTIGMGVAITGNHEFDAGVGELKRLVAGGCAATVPDGAVTSCALSTYGGMRFPFVSSNVLDADGKTVFAPSTVVRFAGIPVGFVGAVTKTLPTLVSPSGIAGLSIIDEAEAVNRAARRLQAQGVRAIVALFHEGGELGTPQHRGKWNDASCPDAHGPIFSIAERLLPEITVIFTGHTHQGYRCLIHGRTLIQGTSYGRGVSVVDVVLDPKTRRIVPSKTRSINLPVLNERTDPAVRERIAATLPAPYAAIVRAARSDPAIASIVERYAVIVAPKAERPVARIEGRFARGGLADSAAGRLIADAQLAATAAPAQGGAQIAFMNPGGIRSDLDCIGTPPCTVTFGQAFTMQPFGNTLVVMTLTGAQIKALLEAQSRPSGVETTMLQPSAGFTYAWQPGAPVGSRASDLRLGGEPIVAERSYRVAVNSFLAEGGDGFAVLTEGTGRDGGAPDLDVLLEYLKTPRAPDSTARITLLR
ncbi:MAG: bifunctional metallophosphatase/5'-nucleotidase [Pseudomonadota bacterium]|nr:bifunctional metallophosphatase/5'-nucleotidase [Pseudomonadota bacterium]